MRAPTLDFAPSFAVFDLGSATLAPALYAARPAQGCDRGLDEADATALVLAARRAGRAACVLTCEPLPSDSGLIEVEFHTASDFLSGPYEDRYTGAPRGGRLSLEPQWGILIASVFTGAIEMYGLDGCSERDPITLAMAHPPRNGQRRFLLRVQAGAAPDGRVGFALQALDAGAPAFAVATTAG